MQKQFLLNTLLLIGAICLSTRGFAEINQTSSTPVQNQIQTSTTDTVHPQSHEAPTAATSHDESSMMHSTSAHTSDDQNEEMD